MGFIIFIILFVCEMSLFFICIATKSFHLKLRSFIRILVLAFFVIFGLLSIIKWGPSYYTLAIFLFFMGLKGIILMINKKYKINDYTFLKLFKNTIGIIVLVYLVIFPAILFPQYKTIAYTGDHQISTATHHYIDESRLETYKNNGESRELNVKYWYPVNSDGIFPLIIFSHGGISFNTSNESLYLELASHGYVVAAINHTYHSLYTTNQDNKIIYIDRNYMNELNSEDAKNNPVQSYEYYQKWMNIRIGDINYIIDYIIQQTHNNNVNGVYELIDISNIGVIGHSLGGSAALGIGRIRNDIKAVVALESPYLYDIIGVNNYKFEFIDEVYPIPVLNVYSDSSWNNLNVWPQYLQNYRYLYESESHIYNVNIEGVGHFSLTDLAISSPILTRLFNGFNAKIDARDGLLIINQICLDFFNSYLKE